MGSANLKNYEVICNNICCNADGIGIGSLPTGNGCAVARKFAFVFNIKIHIFYIETVLWVTCTKFVKTFVKLVVSLVCKVITSVLFKIDIF